MRCRYCHHQAGLFRSSCVSCTRAVEIFEQSVGRAGWTELVDRFATAGLTKPQVDCVLDAEIGGKPSLRDRMTAEMANVLLRGLGMPGRQSPADVRRIRRGDGPSPEEELMSSGGACAGEGAEAAVQDESAATPRT